MSGTNIVSQIKFSFDFSLLDNFDALPRKQRRAYLESCMQKCFTDQEVIRQYRKTLNVVPFREPEVPEIAVEFPLGAPIMDSAGGHKSGGEYGEEAQSELRQRINIAMEASGLTKIKFGTVADIPHWIGLSTSVANAVVRIEDEIAKLFPDRHGYSFAASSLFPKIFTFCCANFSAESKRKFSVLLKKVAGDDGGVATDYILELLCGFELRLEERIEVGCFLGGYLGMAILSPVFEYLDNQVVANNFSSENGIELLHLLVRRMSNPQSIDTGKVSVGPVILELNEIQDLSCEPTTTFAAISSEIGVQLEIVLSSTATNGRRKHFYSLLFGGAGMAAVRSHQKYQLNVSDAFFPYTFAMDSAKFSEMCLAGTPLLIAQQCNGRREYIKSADLLLGICRSCAVDRSWELVDAFLTVTFLFVVQEYFMGHEGRNLTKLADFVAEFEIDYWLFGSTVDLVLSMSEGPETLDGPPIEWLRSETLINDMRQLRARFEYTPRVVVGPTNLELRNIDREIRKAIGSENYFALSPAIKKQLREALFGTRILDLHLQPGRNYGGDVISLVTGFEQMLTDALSPIYEDNLQSLTKLKFDRPTGGKYTLGNHSWIFRNFHRLPRGVQRDLQQKIPLIAQPGATEKLSNLTIMRNEGGHRTVDLATYRNVRDLPLGDGGLFPTLLGAKFGQDKPSD